MKSILHKQTHAPPKNSRSREASSAKPSGLAASLAFGEDSWRRQALQAWPAVLRARAWYSKTAITKAAQPQIPHLSCCISFTAQQVSAGTGRL